MLVPAAKRPGSGFEPRHAHRKGPQPQTKVDLGRKPGKNAGKSGGNWENDPVLSDDDAAQDTYSGDQIVLDHFIREFILLELPMIPLREDLRGAAFEANPPLPDTGGAWSKTDASPSGSAERPLDPRFSALAELKAQLEKKE